jgi:hypothetical protein
MEMERGDAPVKRNPLHLIQQYQSRRDQQFAEMLDVDAVLFVTLEVDAGFGEELDGFGSVHVVAAEEEQGRGNREERNVSANSAEMRSATRARTKLLSAHVGPIVPHNRRAEELGEKGNRSNSLDAKREVELPRADSWCQLAVLVRKGDTELNDPEQVDVTPEGLVVVVARATEGSDRTGDDARELGVLLRERRRSVGCSWSSRRTKDESSRMGGEEGEQQLQPLDLIGESRRVFRGTDGR